MATQQITKTATEQSNELQNRIATINAAILEKKAQIPNATSANQHANLRSEVDYMEVERDRAISTCNDLRHAVAKEELEQCERDARDNQDVAIIVREIKALEERLRQRENDRDAAMFHNGNLQRALHEAQAREAMFRSTNKRDVEQRQAEEREFRQRLERL